MRELQKIRAGKKVWYVDFRLEQVRNVNNPHEFMTFREFNVRYDLALA